MSATNSNVSASGVIPASAMSSASIQQALDDLAVQKAKLRQQLQDIEDQEQTLLMQGAALLGSQILVVHNRLVTNQLAEGDEIYVHSDDDCVEGIVEVSLVKPYLWLRLYKPRSRIKRIPLQEGLYFSRTTVGPKFELT